jgi:hemolysin activation/secretion protein
VSQRKIITCQLLLAIASGAQPDSIQAGQPPGPAPGASTAQRFDVHEYRVLGNTVLSARQIEAVLYPRLGDGKLFADVEAARAALEAAYHSLGFATVFVDIPPQDVNDGIVRLRVTEGRVHERTISGARYFSEGKILEALPAIEPGTVPQLKTLQEELNKLNTQSADRSVVPVLKAGAEPGTMDVALKVEDHLPLHGMLEVDNQSTPDTKPLRATASLSYGNLFQDLDSISLWYTTAPQALREVRVGNVTYGFHPFADGIRPSLSFTDSKSNVTSLSTLGTPSGVLGNGQIASAHATAPIEALPGNVQSLTFGLDYKHFRNTLDQVSSTTGATAVIILPVSYVNVSLGYLGAWQWGPDAGSPRQLASFDLTANVGPRGLANETLSFGSNRIQARGNYAYLRADAAFTTHLPGNLALMLRASGQTALEPLLVYEQVSIAGSDGVRGYLESEALGDTAIKGGVQLQSPPVRHGTFLLGDAFVFFDAGHSHSIDPLKDEPVHIILRSYGAGIELLPGHSVTGQLTWAQPLVQGADTRAHASRLLFDIKGSF